METVCKRLIDYLKTDLFTAFPDVNLTLKAWVKAESTSNFSKRYNYAVTMTGIDSGPFVEIWHDEKNIFFKKFNWEPVSCKTLRKAKSIADDYIGSRCQYIRKEREKNKKAKEEREEVISLLTNSHNLFTSQNIPSHLFIGHGSGTPCLCVTTKRHNVPIQLKVESGKIELTLDRSFSATPDQIIEIITSL